MNGTVLIKTALGTEWRDVSANDLSNAADDPLLQFRAVQPYASQNGFVGGFPNFYQGKERILLPTPPGFKVVKVYDTVLLA